MQSRRMTVGRSSSVVTIVLLGLVLLTSLDTVSGVPYKRSLLRLCSKSLSDALTLVCAGRGYNEPFSYTEDGSPQDSNGPGLAEECCHHTCSMSQLEQYCRSESDAVKDSIWILNIPFPPYTGEAVSSEERSRLSKSYADFDYVGTELKHIGRDVNS